MITDDRDDGHIALLPVGSIRSVVTINPPSSKQVYGKYRRRVLPTGPLRANAAPSIATSSYYRNNTINGGRDEEYGSRNGERITLVATCIPRRTDADDKHDSRCCRIALATIVDSPHGSDPQCCRVVGMQYSLTDSSSPRPSLSTVCIATTKFQHMFLLAIDASGRIYTHNITDNYVDSQCKEVLDMQDCHFRSVGTQARSKRGKKSDKYKKSTPDGSTESDFLPLTMVNTLNARLESTSSFTSNGTASRLISDSPRTTSVIFSRKSPRRSPAKTAPAKNKGRKRKHSPAKKGDSSSNAGDATNTERIYLVASNLNESVLPSQAPPTVMLLSSPMTDSSNDSDAKYQWNGLDSAQIPGLENVDVPITCVIFFSRSKCGTSIWDGIISAMRSNDDIDAMAPKNTDQIECDEGVVLMGFEDGSLRGSLVITNMGLGNATLDISKATTLLQLSANEPFISIQLLPSRLSLDSTASSIGTDILICVGALGTLVTLSSCPEQSKKSNVKTTPKFATENPMKLCGGRWTSMSCFGYCFLDEANSATNSRCSIPSLGLSFLGVNDSNQTYLYCISLHGNRQPGNGVNEDLGYCSGRKHDIFRIPLPSKMTSSIHTFPGKLSTSSGHSIMHVTFAVSAPSGKAVMLRMRLPGKAPSIKALPSPQLCRRDRPISFILSTLKGERSSEPGHDFANKTSSHRKQKKRDHHNKIESSKMQSLIQMLDLATAKQNENKSNQIYDSFYRKTDDATKEIREVTHVSAFIKRSLFNATPSPMQCGIKKLSTGVLKCAFRAEKLPLTRQPATSWLASVHILKSCLHMLSPILRPQSLERMSPICYRRTARGDVRPTAVVFGGTATSYNGDIEDSVGGVMNIDVGTNDLIPVSAYASFTMVYTDHVSGMSQNIIADTWDKSARIVSIHSAGCWKPRHKVPPKDEYIQPKMSRSPGLAKRSSSHRSSKYDEFIGVSLPFNIGTKASNAPGLTLDILSFAQPTGLILTHPSESDQHPGIVNSRGENGSRDIAEKHVLLWYQDRSSRVDNDYVIPMLKEQQWIRNHPVSSIVGLTEESKVYCCSGSIPCTNIKERKDYCVNTGFGSMAIVNFPNNATTSNQEVGDVSFAVGSSIVTPSESMAILPLIRQAIVRHSLDQLLYSQTTLRSSALKLPEKYRRLLSEKKTAKITKHIDRTVDELSANITMTAEHSCPAELLSTSISLYETMRSNYFSFELH